MRLDLTGRHVDITDGVRRVVESKLARLERKLNDSAVSAQVVLSREKNGSSRVDVTLHARGEKFLHSIGKGASFGVAMADATDKLSQQAQKIKGKWEARKRRGGKDRDSLREPAASDAAAEARPRVKRAAVRAPRAIKTVRHRLTSMSLADATRAVSADQPVTVFRDADTNRIAVLFQFEGNLTLIETDA